MLKFKVSLAFDEYVYAKNEQEALKAALDNLTYAANAGLLPNLPTHKIEISNFVWPYAHVSPISQLEAALQRVSELIEVVRDTPELGNWVDDNSPSIKFSLEDLQTDISSLPDSALFTTFK